MKKLPLIILFILLILAVIIFFNNNFPPIQFITSSVQSIFGGPKIAIYNLKTGKVQDSQLKQENARLTKELIDYQRIKRDNDALRSQFDTQATKTFTLMPVKILGFSGSSQNPLTLIIDHGANANVKSDSAVIINNNLIGKIGKVSQNYSEVILTTNLSFKALAKTSDTGAAGVAMGDEDFILLDRVSVNDTLNKSTFLLTSGDVSNQGFGIPPDLVIGKIVSINRSPNLPFQTAKVVSSINFGKLETVFVVERF